MKRNGWDLKTSYLYVRERRHIIGPHYHLKTQLVQYEKLLHGKNSLSIEEWHQLQHATRSRDNPMAY